MPVALAAVIQDGAFGIIAAHEIGNSTLRRQHEHITGEQGRLHVTPFHADVDRGMRGTVDFEYVLKFAAVLCQQGGELLLLVWKRTDYEPLEVNTVQLVAVAVCRNAGALRSL